MIGEDKKPSHLSQMFYDCPSCGQEVNIDFIDSILLEVKNQALQDIRDKAPEIAERIDNEIYKPVEYNTAQKYVLKTALENLGEMDDEQYEFIRNNLLNRFK
jgi:hypothetical protein